MEDLKLDELFYSTRESGGMIFLLTDRWARRVGGTTSKQAGPAPSFGGQSDRRAVSARPMWPDASAQARQCSPIPSLPPPLSGGPTFLWAHTSLILYERDKAQISLSTVKRPSLLSIQSPLVLPANSSLRFIFVSSNFFSCSP
uniref:Uncharacterized protein n=1 Tax=Setaria italica TaxID=4555 RepID=K3XZV0_SETIT